MNEETLEEAANDCVDLYNELASLLEGNRLDVVLMTLTRALVQGAAANGIAPDKLLDTVTYVMADVYKDFTIPEGEMQ
jgi:hypothetical protein